MRTGCVIGLLASWLASWPAGCVASWQAGLLASWLASWPTTWLVSWLASWLCSRLARIPYPHHSNNTHRILYPQQSPGRIQTLIMEHTERRECHLSTPQQEFSSSFVSSAIVRQDPDIQYGAYGTPSMPVTHTTARILLELCILNQRPIISRHVL